MMKIKVFVDDKELSYEIADDVTLGDTVHVPPPPWAKDQTGHREGVVTAVTTDYPGPLKQAWVPEKES
jgi:hypothetical protein